MSKIISELIGKRCKIKSEDAWTLETKCMVLDADDEWIKIEYTDKKNVVLTKIIRIDSIDNIELTDD